MTILIKIVPDADVQRKDPLQRPPEQADVAAEAATAPMAWTPQMEVILSEVVVRERMNQQRIALIASLGSGEESAKKEKDVPMHASPKGKDSRNQKVRAVEPQLRARLETAQMAKVPAATTRLVDLSPKMKTKKTAAARATHKEQARCLKAKIMKMIAKARLPLV